MVFLYYSAVNNIVIITVVSSHFVFQLSAENIYPFKNNIRLITTLCVTSSGGCRITFFGGGLTLYIYIHIFKRAKMSILSIV